MINNQNSNTGYSYNPDQNAPENIIQKQQIDRKWKSLRLYLNSAFYHMLLLPLGYSGFIR